MRLPNFIIPLVLTVVCVSCGEGDSKTNEADTGEALSLWDSCQAYCKAYADRCGPTESCEAYCTKEIDTKVKVCDGLLAEHFACAAKGPFDCQMTLGLTPTLGCGMDKYAACVVENRATCNRFASMDNLCAKRKPDVLGYLCKASTAPAECIRLEENSTDELQSMCCTETVVNN